MRSYLAKHHISVVPHPPLSPDLAPADFCLFPKIKTTLNRCRFQTIGEIQENTIRELRAITESTFQEASNNGINVGNGVSPVGVTTLKGTVLKMLLR
jgi:transposase